jgi:hypothetical protein
MLTGVIILVLGVIVSNLLLLRQTAKFAMKKPEEEHPPQADSDSTADPKSDQSSDQ